MNTARIENQRNRRYEVCSGLIYCNTNDSSHDNIAMYEKGLIYTATIAIQHHDEVQ